MPKQKCVIKIDELSKNLTIRQRLFLFFLEEDTFHATSNWQEPAHVFLEWTTTLQQSLKNPAFKKNEKLTLYKIGFILWQKLKLGIGQLNHELKIIRMDNLPPAAQKNWKNFNLCFFEKNFTKNFWQSLTTTKVNKKMNGEQNNKKKN